MTNESDFNFLLAYELTIKEFCEICQKNGMTAEETKKAIIENTFAIAERIKEIMPK